MIKVNDQNKSLIVEEYARAIMQNMDDDSIWALAYDCIIANKTKMNNKDLNTEIIRNHPYLLYS